VDLTNVSSQGYYAADAQEQCHKVVATRKVIGRIDPGIQVETVADRYRPSLSVHEAVFCCVDSISV